MSKLKEAQEILKALGLPPAQYNELAALTFLAICNIKENDKWSNATRQSLRVTKGIMTFVNDNYAKSYAPNTRETFRRQVLHQFVQARVVDYNPDKPDLPHTTFDIMEDNELYCRGLVVSVSDLISD